MIAAINSMGITKATITFDQLPIDFIHTSPMVKSVSGVATKTPI